MGIWSKIADALWGKPGQDWTAGHKTLRLNDYGDFKDYFHSLDEVAKANSAYGLAGQSVGIDALTAKASEKAIPAQWGIELQEVQKKPSKKKKVAKKKVTRATAKARIKNRSRKAK
jgi:hypothetical protein